MLFKLVIGLSLVATSYATSTRNTNIAAYAKVSIHCAAKFTYDGDSPSQVVSECVVDVATADDGGTAAVLLTDLQTNFGKTTPINAQFLVTLPYKDMDNIDQIQMAGNCVNYKMGVHGGATPTEFFGAIPDKSFRLQMNDDLSVDLATTVKYAGINCTGTATASAFGFKWATQATQGKKAIAGDTGATFGLIGNWGLDINAAMTASVEATAHRWTNKKNFAGQLVGPYSSNKCRTLDSDGATTVFLPVVVPIEAADAETGEEAFSEPAVSSTKKCRSMRGDLDGSTVNEARWYAFSTSSTADAGELTFSLSHGNAANLVGGATLVPTTCAAGATHHEATFVMTWDGTFSNCVQAKDAAGQTVSFYYKLIPSLASTGNAWPSTIPAPSTGCPAGTSPASGLHLSAFMAAGIAFIAMMM